MVTSLGSLSWAEGADRGDPLSPYLFLLCSEILARKVKSCEAIKGLNLEGVIIKLSQYADDTQFIMGGSKSSLEAAMTILKEFYYYSGLKINIKKTLAVWLASDERICREYNLNWKNEPFNILGVTLFASSYNRWDLNGTNKLKQIITTDMEIEKTYLTR